jgi:hypothetical protein
MEGNVDTTGSEQHNERPEPVSASGLRTTSSNSALRRRDKRNDRRNYHPPDALENLREYHDTLPSWLLNAYVN